ncbi:MAG: tetratricopeptide repeat protein, partial [Desulfuromonadaceae bacterium]
MKRILLLVLAIPAILTACQSGGSRETIAQLRNMKIEIREEAIEGGLVKAMESYQRFLEETPESALTPEAMRRLADLKIEREYGYLTVPGATQPSPKLSPTVSEIERGIGRAPAPVLSMPERAPSPKVSAVRTAEAPHSAQTELQSDFEKRAIQSPQLAAKEGKSGGLPEAGTEDLERAGAREAIAVYKKLLDKFPLYEGNDRVLYQMTRAYEELGQTEDAMVVMDRLVRDFPRSRYIDEVRFRRAEYFFTRRLYLDAEAAYKSIVEVGVSSPY